MGWRQQRFFRSGRYGTRTGGGWWNSEGYQWFGRLRYPRCRRLGNQRDRFGYSRVQWKLYRSNQSACLGWGRYRQYRCEYGGQDSESRSGEYRSERWPELGVERCKFTMAARNYIRWWRRGEFCIRAHRSGCDTVWRLYGSAGYQCFGFDSDVYQPSVAHGGDVRRYDAQLRSVFGRTGAVVTQSGDYTAAQVTNALDSTQTYTSPLWLTAVTFGGTTLNSTGGTIYNNAA